MKVAIVGSRNIDNLQLLEQIWEDLKLGYDHIIISGGAKGVDKNAKQLATKYGMDIIEYLPDWKKYGRAAGLVRNDTIIQACDMCICVWDGDSHGTKHDIELCKKYNKKCFVWNQKNTKFANINKK